MDFQRLQYFMQTVHSGNISRAAEKLHIAQPSLSVQLQKLEDEVGGRLFERTSRGVVLTNLGRILYRHTERLLQRVDDMKEDLRSGVSGDAGEIRIGTINSIGLYFLPRILKSFINDYPLIEPRVHFQESDQILERLLHRDFDLALVARNQEFAGVVNIPLAEDPLVLVGAPDTELAQKGAVEVEELTDKPFISFAPEIPTGALINQFLSARGVTPKSIMTTDQVGTIIKMVEIGMGVAFLPNMVLGGHIKEGNLAPIEVKNCKMERTIYACLLERQGMQTPRQVQAFLDILKAHVKEIMSELSWKK